MSTNKNSNLVPLICKIQYQFIENINSITRGSSKFHRLVEFIEGEDWLDFYHTPGSISYDQIFSNTNAGRLYNQKISLIFPGEDIDNTGSMEDLAGPALIILLTWSNEQMKIIGDLTNPVRILPDFKSDPDRTGFTINIDHKSSHPAFWYETESGGGGIPD